MPHKKRTWVNFFKPWTWLSWTSESEDSINYRAGLKYVYGRYYLGPEENKKAWNIIWMGTGYFIVEDNKLHGYRNDTLNADLLVGREVIELPDVTDSDDTNEIVRKFEEKAFAHIEAERNKVYGSN